MAAAVFDHISCRQTWLTPETGLALIIRCGCCSRSSLSLTGWRRRFRQLPNGIDSREDRSRARGPAETPGRVHPVDRRYIPDLFAVCDCVASSFSASLPPASELRTAEFRWRADVPNRTVQRLHWEGIVLSE